MPMTPIPIDNKMTDKVLDLYNSIGNRRNRIKEQHSNILEIDVMLSDDPLVPTTEEMLNKYVEQELLIEIKREFGVIVSGK
jgi:hypothetical protein